MRQLEAHYENHESINVSLLIYPTGMIVVASHASHCQCTILSLVVDGARELQVRWAFNKKTRKRHLRAPLICWLIHQR